MEISSSVDIVLTDPQDCDDVLCLNVERSVDSHVQDGHVDGLPLGQEGVL